MQNQNQILQLKNAVAILTHIASASRVLIADKTPMPDGSGTVADHLKQAVSDFELPYLQMMEAIESAGQMAGKVQEAAKTDEAAKTEKQAQSVPARAVPSSDLVLALGDFHIYGDKSMICVFLPNQEDAIDLPLNVELSSSRGWILSGTDEKPTLTPSIDVRGVKPWHGFLTNGDFICCGESPAPAKAAPAAPKSAVAPLVNAPKAVQAQTHAQHADISEKQPTAY